MKTIGGVLDYEVLAQRHRPTDQDGMRIAARALAAQGLRVRDIAASLKVSEPAVTAPAGVESYCVQRGYSRMSRLPHVPIEISDATARHVGQLVRDDVPLPAIRDLLGLTDDELHAHLRRAVQLTVLADPRLGAMVARGAEAAQICADAWCKHG